MKNTAVQNPIAYLSHEMELIRMERDYDRQMYGKILQAENIADHINESNCRYPITIVNSGFNALERMVVTINYEVDEDELEFAFEPGKAVEFFYLSPDRRTIKVVNGPCFVERVDSGVMEIGLPNITTLQRLRDIARNSEVGIQIGIDETSYEVMLDSLSTMMRTDNERLLHLRNVLLGTAEPEFRTLPKVNCPWLNTSQNEAIQKVVEAKDVAIVHGPPGTGKTTTLVEAIIETLQKETQVMVCAPSNTAVDWISEQLMRRGIHVLRIGNPLRMSDEMLDCSYERRYAAHPDYSELWNIRRVLRSGQKEGKSIEKQAQRQKLKERQNELEIKIKNDLFDAARVVSCTLIGSAYTILERRHFSTLFIDEAAQALAPACWAAITKCNRVILSGDHQQLPPTVKCIQAARGGLEHTLMQYVVKHKPMCVTQLQTQYRMHRDIMGFSSKWFYHGKLNAAPEVADRMISPLDSPLTWIDTSDCDFQEKENARTQSKMNAEEARLLVHVVRDYVEMIGMNRIEEERVDFGIISPYKAQVKMIRRLLKMQKFFKTLKRQITINSVDGFQGQERDVIVISMVRDNDEGTIGFLRDLRRMNVALTRARMKLIIIGNSETISKYKFYKELIEYFKEKGAFVVHQKSPTPEA